MLQNNIRNSDCNRNWIDNLKTKIQRKFTDKPSESRNYPCFEIFLFRMARNNYCLEVPWSCPPLLCANDKFNISTKRFQTCTGPFFIEKDLLHHQDFIDSSCLCSWESSYYYMNNKHTKKKNWLRNVSKIVLENFWKSDSGVKAGSFSKDE